MNTEITESCGDIFQDLGFSPSESGKLNIKYHLMSKIEAYIIDKNLTQEQAARMMGVNRPRISDVVRGKIDKFTIDALVDMLTKVGCHIDIHVKEAA